MNASTPQLRSYKAQSKYILRLNVQKPRYRSDGGSRLNLFKEGSFSFTIPASAGCSSETLFLDYCLQCFRKNSPPTHWNLNIHHCENMMSHVNAFEFPTALLHSASFNTTHLHFRDQLDMLRNRKKLVSHKWWQGHLNFDIFCLRKNCHRSEYAL